MPPTSSTFWVRRSDLERLFGAERICYLIGDYDGFGNSGQADRLAANVERVTSLISGVLSVPLSSWQHLDGRDNLAQQHASLFGDACFVYHTVAHALPSDDPGVPLNDELAELVGRPPAYSRVLVSIEGSSDERAWEQMLDMVEALHDWLSLGGELSEPSPYFLIVGQQKSGASLEGPHSARFVRLLERSAAIVARDQTMFESINEQCDEDIRSKLFFCASETDVSLKHPSTTTLLCKFLNTGYIESLQAKYRSTIEKLLQTMEQLSEVQFDYGRLLNYKSDLQVFRGRVVELEAKLEEFTFWGQRATEDVAERDAIIRDLQARLEEQTAWALRSAEEVARRDAIIQHLQSQPAGGQAQPEAVPPEPAPRPDEAVACDGTIADLRAELAATRTQLEDAQRAIAEVQTSRAWRLTTRYWRARERIKRVLWRSLGT